MTKKRPYVPARNQRLNPELYTYSNRVYFITIRSYRNQRVFMQAEMNHMVIDMLRDEQDRQNFSVYTYCLMPDHVHFLVSPRIDGLSVLAFTERYKGKTTNQSWKLGWTGKLWQQRYYDHVVRTEESLGAIARYILDNPVRRNYVDYPEEWLWSGTMNPLPFET